MNKYIFDKLDNAVSFFETARGMLALGATIALCFILFSLSNPNGILAPGLYFFGVIGACALLFRSAYLQVNKKTQLLTGLFALSFLIWSIVNTFFRS